MPVAPAKTWITFRTSLILFKKYIITRSSDSFKSESVEVCNNINILCISLPKMRSICYFIEHASARVALLSTHCICAVRNSYDDIWGNYHRTSIWRLREIWSWIDRVLFSSGFSFFCFDFIIFLRSRLQEQITQKQLELFVEIRAWAYAIIKLILNNNKTTEYFGYLCISYATEIILFIWRQVVVGCSFISAIPLPW